MATADDLGDLRFELLDRVAVITLDRPERRNAFTAAMGNSFGRAYRAAVARGARRGAGAPARPAARRRGGGAAPAGDPAARGGPRRPPPRAPRPGAARAVARDSAATPAPLSVAISKRLLWASP